MATPAIMVITTMMTMMMTMMNKHRRRVAGGQSGLSLLELIITLAILAMLASATLPLAYNTVKRNRELELRRALRELRVAIDNYKHYSDTTVPPGQLIPIQERTPSGYPKNLDILVKGFTPANQVNDKKIRFL